MRVVMFRLMLLGALAVAGWATVTVGDVLAADSPVPGYVAAALADTTRPPGNAKINLSRKPAETIAFADVKPGMSVGEFFPGRGYFTRMLSAVIGASGHDYAVENVAWTSALEGVNAEGRLTNVSLEVLPFGTVRFPKPLDIVWISQNYHDLKIAEYGQVDTAAFSRADFASLKPGGTYFIPTVPGHAATEEQQIAGLDSFDISAEMRRRLRELDT
jgi:predicted methyltransferase